MLPIFCETCYTQIEVDFYHASDTNTSDIHVDDRTTIFGVRCIVKEESEWKVFRIETRFAPILDYVEWRYVNANLLTSTRLCLSQLCDLSRDEHDRLHRKGGRARKIGVSLFILKKSAEQRISRERKNIVGERKALVCSFRTLRIM